MTLRIEPDIADIRRTVLRLEARANAVGRVTLDRNATKTVVSDYNISPFSTIVLTPMSASTAALTFWIELGKGTFTIHHSSSAASDRMFGWAVIG